MLSGFKTFIMRGNVVDLAIGVVIGAAFGDVVNSLVKDIITPLIAALTHTPDFSKMALNINGTAIMYGSFLNAAISFLTIALAIYYFVVLPLNKLMEKAGRQANIAVPKEEVQ